MKRTFQLNVVRLMGLKLFLFLAICASGIFFFKIDTGGFYYTLVTLFAGTLFWIFVYRKKLVSEPIQSSVQLATDVALENVLIHFSGGAESPFIFLLIFDLFFGALMLPEKMMFVLTAYVAVSYAVFTTLAYRGFLPPLLEERNLFEVSPDVYFYYLVYMRMFIFVMIGYLASQLASRIYFQKAAIEHMRQLTEKILFQMGSGLVTVDEGGKILYSNKAAAVILGVSNEALLGVNWRDVFLKGEGDPEREKLFKTGALDATEFEVKRRDGSRVFVGVSSSGFKVEEEHVSGRTLVFRDITANKEIEELRAEQKKTKTLGEVAAAMAHEIKNPLASICGSLEVLLESQEFENEKSKKLVNVILKESERLSRTLSDFLSFAGDIPLKREERDLRDLIDEVFLILENSSEKKEGIVLRKRISEESSFTANVDENSFKQLLLNLALNGIQSIAEPNGEVTVSLRKSLPESGKAGSLLLEVADTGSGISESHREDIFKPFFSTRKKGIGLGLHVCKQIAEKHGWDIAFRPASPKGTVFAVSMPL